MRLKTISFTFSIIGILVLYFISTLTQPIIVDIKDIPKYEGKEITTKGYVSDSRNNRYGSQLIEIKNGNKSVSVFLEGYIDVEYGDKISVTGDVQEYNDEWEIIVNDPRLIHIVQKWDNISFPIWQLARNPIRYEGLNVNVTGFIDRVYDSYFYLIDLEDKNSLMVSSIKNQNYTLYPGQKVQVSGLFLFDEKNFQYTLSAFDEKHGIILLNEA